jgi:hypothetical protein
MLWTFCKTGRWVQSIEATISGLGSDERLPASYNNKHAKAKNTRQSLALILLLQL